MIKLANGNKTFSKQGLGCMAMSEFYGKPVPDQQSIKLIGTAYDSGINFFDTADMYGLGHNEQLLGRAVTALKNRTVAREDFIVATKCGVIRDKKDRNKSRIDNSYAYVKSACDASLQRLGSDVSYIDLYYIHRVVDHGAKIAEAMRAMAELLEAGKIKAVGLSEVSSETIIAANKALLDYTNGKHQLSAVQAEYSLLTRVIEKNGVLDTCRKLGISLVAYSPLSRALLTGEIEHKTLQQNEDDFRPNMPRFQEENLRHNLTIVQQVQQLAEKKRCSAAQLALAWLFSKTGVIPIPGTTKTKHLLANIAAENVNLNKEDIALLDNLAAAKGLRYPEAAMRKYGLEGEIDIPDA